MSGKTGSEPEKDVVRDLRSMPTPEEGFQGRIKCEPEEAKVGEVVEVTGENLPPQDQFKLLWRTNSVDWKIERNSDGVLWQKFFGFKHQERQKVISIVETDEDGRFNREVEIPEDFGGLHDLYLIREEKRINKVGVRIIRSFEVSPNSGPLGSPITITAHGLPLPAANFVENSIFHIYYDNKYTGLISPVTFKGTCEINIPATGQPGTHIVDVERSQFGNAHSYRQTHIGLTPLPGTPDLSWKFELTEGEPVLPPPIGDQVPDSVPRENSGLTDNGRPSLTTDYWAIPVNSSLEVMGAGFPENTEVKLIWPELEGSNIREESFEEKNSVIVRETTGGDGRFAAEIKPAPKTVQGGPHPIHAIVNEKKAATTSAIVLPVFQDLSRKEGSIGDQITINAQGIGWNEIWNQVTILYDNSFIGYACGGDIPGIIEAKLRATGKPGWHLIDIYPTIQKQRNFAEEAFEIPFIYRLPFLNWNSHPQGYHFRYAFKIE
ncbi:hypothetical protein KGY79_00690 [Candidatus Bipolaricaulota bacterium]|nr:hypothetical protein [Candidatus Bipolaricaulota bacterium]